MPDTQKLFGRATVRLDDVVAGDLDSFLDLIGELSFGPEDCAAAVGIDYTIVGFTAETLTLDVSADRDPNSLD